MHGYTAGMRSQNLQLGLPQEALVFTAAIPMDSLFPNALSTHITSMDMYQWSGNLNQHRSCAVRALCIPWKSRNQPCCPEICPACD